MMYEAGLSTRDCDHPRAAALVLASMLTHAARRGLCCIYSRQKMAHFAQSATLQQSQQELSALTRHAAHGKVPADVIEPAVATVNAGPYLCRRAFLTAPHHGFGPTQRCELRCAQRSLTNGEELVELRRLYARAG